MPVTAQLLFIACTVLNKHVWIPLSFPLTITITEAEKKPPKNPQAASGLIKKISFDYPDCSSSTHRQHLQSTWNERETFFCFKIDPERFWIQCSRPNLISNSTWLEFTRLSGLSCLWSDLCPVSQAMSKRL